MKRIGNKLKLVSLTFWDHISGPADTTKALKCEISGWLIKESNVAYYINTWIAEGNPFDSNSEVYVIIKSTVIKKRVLNAGY